MIGESDHRNDRERDDAQLEVPSYQGGADVDETKSVTDEALAQALETSSMTMLKNGYTSAFPDPKVDDYITTFAVTQQKIFDYFYDEDRDTIGQKCSVCCRSLQRFQERHSEDCQLSV